MFSRQPFGWRDGNVRGPHGCRLAVENGDEVTGVSDVTGLRRPAENGYSVHGFRLIKYRAFALPNGTINVGTRYPVTP